MDTESISTLAIGPKESPAALGIRLQELKSQGAGILLCILYVKINQQCPLHEASEIVLKSDAWIDQKDAFLQHQEDMLQEYIESAKDDIESIKQTYTTDRTWTTINMKRNN